MASAYLLLNTGLYIVTENPRLGVTIKVCNLCMFDKPRR